MKKDEKTIDELIEEIVELATKLTEAGYGKIQFIPEM